MVHPSERVMLSVHSVSLVPILSWVITILFQHTIPTIIIVRLVQISLLDQIVLLLDPLLSVIW